MNISLLLRHTSELENSDFENLKSSPIDFHLHTYVSLDKKKNKQVNI